MTMKYKKPELLAPAGSLEKLKIAFQYGADAVYFGGEAFSLRAAAQNFSFEEIKEGAELAHSLGKKIYCTVNVMPRNEGIEKLPEFLKSLEEAKVDAVLVSDLGVFRTVQKHTNLPIHISTQANTVNYEGCNMWHDLGAERVVLARECSLKEIKEIREHIPEELELEVFVHGAMCMSYSGRCLLSSYMTGRDSNRGACAQSCRWKYSLVEEKRPNQYFPIEEDQHGTYIMNSKDLCMIHYIPELVKSGIYSFKIEGRMKSEFYVASVVKAYREALDSYWENPSNYKFKNEWMDMLRKVSHRPYHTGFYLGINGEQNYDDAGYVRDYEIVGMVKSYDPETKTATVLQKNRVFEGEEVEVLRADVPYFKVKLEEMYDLDKDKKTEVANRAHMMFTVKVNTPLKVNDMLVKANNVININNN